MKQASCICGVDVTDGNVMLEHLSTHPKHTQVLLQNDTALYLCDILHVNLVDKEVDFTFHKVRIKKVK